MVKRFVTPFAASGDKLAVPDATQPDGSVSYNTGFGVDYQRPIGDPLRKTMPRDSTNQLFFDLTEFAKEVQENGVPPWRNDVDYAIGAVALGSNGKLYRALQASGPSTSARNPTTQPAYWTAFFTESGGTFTGAIVAPSLSVSASIQNPFVCSTSFGGGDGVFLFQSTGNTAKVKANSAANTASFMTQFNGSDRFEVRGSSNQVDFRFWNSAGAFQGEIFGLALDNGRAVFGLSAANVDANAKYRFANGFMKIDNAAAPGSNPSGGGYLFVEGGALKYRGSSGTVTVIAPA